MKKCSVCLSLLTFMGRLGDRLFYRCRACGFGCTMVSHIPPGVLAREIKQERSTK